VGGQQARHRDESLVRHGIVGQETTGAGGFAKAIRTIPKILEIAARVRAKAPGAWVVNFTNPSGIVTEALLRHGGVEAVGLCNIPVETRMEAAKALSAPPESLELDWVGLNHLGWVRRVRLAGEDITDAVIGMLSGGPANIPDLDYGPDLFAALRMIPSPYLRYFYATEDMVATLQAQPKTRAQVVMELEDRLFAYYRDPATHEKPALLSERGGAWYSRVALSVMEGLLSPVPRVEVVNTLNRGALPWLPDDAVVEVPAEVSSFGVKVRPIEPVPEEILGLIRQVKSYERLTIEAAITQSREKALLALMANPLVRTLAKARAVLADMEAGGEWEV
jgi:6-phospho-beta-glucosidase